MTASADAAGDHGASDAAEGGGAGASELAFDVELSETRVRRWARLSGDRNPLHLDADYAAAAGFGGRIVHGHLLTALIADAMLALVGDGWLHGGELRELRFRAPLAVGATCHVAIGAVPAEPGELRAWTVEASDAANGTVCIAGRARLPEDPPGDLPATGGG